MASTYVNDLRLNEMATGDASGSWGTVTNTNLELIGEALGYGTEGITTNADTHTTTVADGATDPGRAMYIEYTGTLDSACTITIAPNTLNRMHFIENGTSGSQNIIIKQGSGATVTIPPGDTKAVYLDGAGSGAKVVDAFASLNVVDLKVQDDLTVTDDLIVGGDIDLEGAIDVNGTSNLDVVDIDGAVDMASTLAVAGVVTANAGVVVDNITIDGTEIDLSSGDLTLDVAGDIILDADGADFKFRDGGAGFFTISNSSLDAVLKVEQSNEDMLFKGNDGGSEITALTLDMSAAGQATFNEGVKLSGLNGGTGLAFDMAGSGDYVIKESSTDDVMSFQGSLFHNFSNNRVGIGTATPASTLSVHGAVNFNTTNGDGNEARHAFTMGGAADPGIYTIADGAQNVKVQLHAGGETLFGGGAVSVYAGTLFVSGEQSGFSPGSHNGTSLAINGQTTSSRAASNAQTHRIFANTNGTVGSISTNGSATAYNTSSDYRLKENVVTDWNGTTLLKQLKPSKFNFKADADTTVQGFLAHEVSSIVPEAVTGEKDAVYTAEEAAEMITAVEGQPNYQSIDQSKLVPLLVKTIQELESRITTLEG